jgi:hypothetical protein
MTRRRLLWFFIICLLVNLAVSWWVRVPGYMDSEYYFTTAQRVASGEGWTEPYLWNYLDDPETIPHPSHLYWMPLTTLVAAGSMALFGESFRAAQLPFFLITAAFPILTAMLAFRLHKNSRWAFQTGYFALFSGFFMPYLVSTDTFSLYALLGGMGLWVTSETMKREDLRYWFFPGVLAGLAHLTRADGVLFLVLAWIALAWSRKNLIRGTLWLVGGYVLAMSPWLVRNFIVVGRIFPSAAGRTLWLLTYDELFTYPADKLTAVRWWQSGIADLLLARFQALGVNLQRLVAENGMIFLAPAMLIGAKRFWEKAIVRLMALYLVLLLGLMSFIFPFAGSYGGFFHSSVAAMPVLWVLTPPGLEAAITWIGARRGWKGGSSQVVLSSSAIVLAIVFSAYFFWNKTIGPSLQEPNWERGMQDYREVGATLHNLSASPGIVAVNNPPGFYLATGVQAIVIPDGPVETLEQVVRRYDVAWVVLDVNRPAGLSALYTRQITPEWMDPVAALEATDGSAIEIFKVVTMETDPG